VWTRALALYVVLAVLTVGWHAVSHMQSVCSCGGGSDPAQYMAAMKWWPFAIEHAINPFVSHYLWAPTGVNLAQAAMIPTASILLTPVTALFGSIFSYNIASIASPALAAFTAYLLCRRLVRRELPALAGGYLFGFGSYEFSQLVGHMNLTLIFLVPVMIHLALRRADRECSRLVYTVAMALVMVAQLGLSTEILADSVGLGAVLLVAAWLLAPRSRRRRIAGLAAETLGAGLLAIIVASPFLYYAVVSSGVPANPSPTIADGYGLDLLNLVFPTVMTWFGHHDFASLSATFEGGNAVEADGYLSVALVFAFTYWWVREGRSRLLGRLLAIGLVLSLVLALGAHLHVAGQAAMSLPIEWVRHVAVFDNILPSRFALFVTLAVAIGVAAWLASPVHARAGRWLVVLIGIFLTFPNLTVASYGVPMHNPPFFATSMYRTYLKRGETVLVLPYAAQDLSTLWQAETGFYFYMPEGYVSDAIPAAFVVQPTVQSLWANYTVTPPTLLAFIHEYAVSDVLVDPTNAGLWSDILVGLGMREHVVGGMILFHVPGAPA
jgi:hypothetical protein